MFESAEVDGRSLGHVRNWKHQVFLRAVAFCALHFGPPLHDAHTERSHRTDGSAAPGEQTALSAVCGALTARVRGASRAVSRYRRANEVDVRGQRCRAGAVRRGELKTCVGRSLQYKNVQGTTMTEAQFMETRCDTFHISRVARVLPPGAVLGAVCPPHPPESSSICFVIG